MTDLNQAILDNEKLVYFAVNRYYPALIHDDDIIQLGRIGLWHALSSYEPGASKFGNYAVLCIKHEIDRYFQCQNYIKRKPPEMVRLDATPANAEEATVHEVILGTTDIDFLDVEAILTALTKRQRMILARLAAGYCVAEIARQVGVTKYHVRKEIKQIGKAILKEVTISEQKRRNYPRS